jgi:hypothetical protein
MKIVDERSPVDPSLKLKFTFCGLFVSKVPFFFLVLDQSGIEPGTFRVKWEPLYHRPLLHDLLYGWLVEHLIINQKYTFLPDPVG